MRNIHYRYPIDIKKLIPVSQKFEDLFVLANLAPKSRSEVPKQSIKVNLILITNASVA